MCQIDGKITTIVSNRQEQREGETNINIRVGRITNSIPEGSIKSIMHNPKSPMLIIKALVFH